MTVRSYCNCTLLYTYFYFSLIFYLNLIFIFYLIFCRPDGARFIVAKDDCTLHRRAVRGDVVTFTYDFARRSAPSHAPHGDAEANDDQTEVQQYSENGTFIFFFCIYLSSFSSSALFWRNLRTILRDAGRLHSILGSTVTR